MSMITDSIFLGSSCNSPAKSLEGDMKHDRAEGGSPRRVRRFLLAAIFTSLTFAGVGLIATASSANAAIIPGRCTYTSSQPTLSQGSSGTAVRQAQCELNYSMRYTKVTVDGSFGPNTAQAVRIFQSCVGIGVDGIIGPVTWSRLNAWAGSNTYLNC